MQAVDGLFEGRTHLYLIDQHIIVLPRLIPRFDILLQRVVLQQALKLRQVEVDMDDVCGGIRLFQPLRKRFHQF